MNTEAAPKPRVYVDTRVVSYLTAKRSRNSVTAAQQRITREWRLSANGRYQLAVSNLLIEKAGCGDQRACGFADYHPTTLSTSERLLETNP